MQYISKDIMLDMLDHIRHQAEFIIETTKDVKEKEYQLYITL